MNTLEQKHEWLKDIPRKQQRQDSLSDQISDLISAANKLGLYDAVDWIENQKNKTGKIK